MASLPREPDEFSPPSGAPDAAAWDALARNAAEPNAFFERWFLEPGLRHFDDGRAQLLPVREDERLLGLLPVIRGFDYYGYPVPCIATWLHPNAFCGAPLVEAGAEQAFWRALFAWADANCGNALFLHLPLLPAEGPLVDALRRVRGRRDILVVRQEERAILRCGPSAVKHYEAALPNKKRKELRRQRNRLAELGELTVERLAGDERLPEWTSEFLALERRGWKGAAGSALACDPRTEALFRDTLAGAAGANRLERLALRLDGRAIAMLVNFLTPPGAFAFKTAFDENYARYSPGVLLQCENLALLERDGLDWCDSCAAPDHPMIERLWRDRRRMVSLNIAIGGPLRRAAFRAFERAETTVPLEEL